MLRKILQRYQQDIVGFGFVYRPYLHVSMLLLMYVSIVVFAYIFKMNYTFMALTITLTTILFPVMLYLVYEYSDEERKFAEFTGFISHICGAFKLHPKILTTLLEAEQVTAGTLHQKVDEVIDNLRNGDTYKEAVQPLTDAYDFHLFHNLIQLMISVEYFGAATYEEGINLIQDDLDDVVEDMYLYQHNLMQIRSKVFILCGLSCVVCFICKYMMSQLYNFDNNIVYQITLFLYVITLFASITASQLFLRHTWCIWRNHE